GVDRRVARLGGDAGGVIDRQRHGVGGGAADAVAEDGLVLVTVLAGAGGEAQRGRGGAADGSPVAAVVGADVPLHGRRGDAVGRPPRRASVAGGGRRVGRLGGDAGGVIDRQRRGAGGGHAEAVVEDRLVQVAVLRGARGEAQR